MWGIVEPEEFGLGGNVAEEALGPDMVADDDVVAFAFEEGFEGAAGAEDGPGAAESHGAEEVDGAVLGAELLGDFAIVTEGEFELELGGAVAFLGEGVKEDFDAAVEVAGVNLQDAH